MKLWAKSGSWGCFSCIVLVRRVIDKLKFIVIF